MIQYWRVHSPLFFTFFLLALLTYVSLITVLQSYSEENLTTTNSEDTAIHIPAVLKDAYTLSSIGFHLTLPEGWRGVNHGYVAMVSPDGINENNGNLKGNENNTLMVIEVINHSDFKNSKREGQIQKNGCKYLSERFLTINGIHTKEITINCGARGDEKVINYVFSSKNKIIIVGLKGTGESFNTHLEDFKNSIRSVEIGAPGQIKQLDAILRS